MRVTVRTIELNTFLEGLPEFSSKLYEQCSKTVKMENDFLDMGRITPQPFSVDIDFDHSELYRYVAESKRKAEAPLKKFINTKKWEDNNRYSSFSQTFEEIAHSPEIGRDVGAIEYIKEKLSSKVNKSDLKLYYDKDLGNCMEIEFNLYLKVTLFYEYGEFGLIVTNETEGAHMHWHHFTYDEAILDMTDIIEGKMVFIIKRRRKNSIMNGSSLQEYESKKKKLFSKNSIAVVSSMGILKGFEKVEKR